jgi:hypothetical protein
MFLHYQKLHLKLCVKYILGLCFVVYICFAQIINICIEIFVQSFTDTVRFLIYRSLFVCNAIILVTLPSRHTAITP